MTSFPGTLPGIGHRNRKGDSIGGFRKAGGLPAEGRIAESIAKWIAYRDTEGRKVPIAYIEPLLVLGIAAVAKRAYHGLPKGTISWFPTPPQ